jgi:large subunit ribosomal protein L15
MALKLENLKPAYGAKKKSKRVGRGDSSGHGTYSTRGAKGQRARSGGKGGLKLKGLKGNILSIPKLGGFRSLKHKLAIVNIKDLDKKFANNDIITTGKLVEKGLIKSAKFGVKVLGMGKLTKKFILKVNKISQTAKEALEKAGGQVILHEREIIGKKDKKENK